MKDDLISRQAAIDALGDMPMSWADTDAEIQAQEDWKQHREALLKLPTAEPSVTLMKVEKGVDMESLKKAMQDAELTLLPAEPRKGKWLVQFNGWGDVYYECSCCKAAITVIEGTPTDNLYYYCPVCGARMEE